VAAYDCRYGTMDVFDDDDLISIALRTYGEWAQLEIDVISNWIPPGAYVLDIGAYIGTHTLAFADLVGANGKVLAFEPNPRPLKLLKSNVERSQKATISVMGIALGEERRFDDLHLNNSTNVASTHLRGDSYSEPVSSVEILPLDALELERVDFIKADVEGYEANVLKGGELTIQQFRPVIFLELNSVDAGAGHLQWAKSHDYTVLGVITEAFNSKNFKGEVRNIFGDAKECGLILIPNDRNQIHRKVESVTLINTVDDLVLLLLHKPQYPSEVLSECAAAETLDTNYPSPRLVKSDREIARWRSEVERLEHTKQVLLEQIETLRTSVVKIDEELGELKLKNAFLSRSLAVVEVERNALLTSRSWKVTKPFRAIGKVVRCVFSDGKRA
jgi:FkbM family methyltransferase